MISTPHRIRATIRGQLLTVHQLPITSHQSPISPGLSILDVSSTLASPLFSPLWRYGATVSTWPFQGQNAGSIPASATKVCCGHYFYPEAWRLRYGRRLHLVGDQHLFQVNESSIPGPTVKSLF